MGQLARQSLPHILADEISKSIRNGDWKNVLPGYRTLCTYYKVSKSTCIVALELLENRDVIEAAEVGKRRKICPCKIENGPRPMNLLIIRDENKSLKGEDYEFLGQMAEHWLRRGGTVQRIRGNLRHWTHPEKLLRTWITNYAGTHLLIHNAPAAWVKAVCEVGIPCYFSGGAILSDGLPKGAISGSAHHLEHSIKMVLTRVKKLGHRQLLIPLEFGTNTRKDMIKNNLAEVYGEDIPNSEYEKILPVFKENTPGTWQRYWKRAFKDRDVSLAFVFSVHHLLSLYVYCQSAGVDLRKDLSVIVFEHSNIMEWLSPRPTSLEFPHHLALADFRRWVKSGCSHKKYHFLKMKWCDGETLRRIE